MSNDAEEHPRYTEFMDDGMVEWCDRLNAIPGVRTWQSCAGHPPGERSKVGERSNHQRSGHIWFTADHFTAEKALALSAHPIIEQVAHLFGREGFPVWEVYFQGRNRSEQHLTESMTAIVEALGGR